MTAINITAEDLTAAIRTIRALRRDLVTPSNQIGPSRLDAVKVLSRIEEMLTPREPDTLVSEVPEFDTVLGFISKYDPFTLDMMVDPVRETIRDGFWLSHRARERGLSIIKVPAPTSVTARYPEVTHLNAYPVELLRERFFGGSKIAA